MEVLEKEEQTNLELSERYNEDERGNKIGSNKKAVFPFLTEKSWELFMTTQLYFRNNTSLSYACNQMTYHCHFFIC